MGLKCGIIGLPNVGKSSLFNALTSSASAKTANYPFCTIEPNLGRVPVPDRRLQEISNLIQPENTLPNVMEFTDIAGLVKGASQGEGLGNQFLSHIRETDSLIHVVRGFEDDNITHIYGSIDPLRDIEVIQLELLLSDIETIEKSLKKLEKLIKGNRSLNNELEITTQLLNHLKSEKRAYDFKIPDSLFQNTNYSSLSAFFKQKGLLSSKPMLYVCNLKEQTFKNKDFSAVRKLQDSVGEHNVLMICADLEAQIAELTEQDKLSFLKDLNYTEPSLYPLIRKAYQQLNLITFFTAGKKEVRAWTLTQGSLAPQAAGVIHSDFEKGFIRAETYHYNDLLKYKSEKALKAEGRLRSEGKTYKVQDGDIMHFLFQG